MLDNLQSPETFIDTLSDNEKAQLTGEGFLGFLKSTFDPKAEPKQIVGSLRKLAKTLRTTGLNDQNQKKVIAGLANLVIGMNGPGSVDQFPIADSGSSIFPNPDDWVWSPGKNRSFRDELIRNDMVPIKGPRPEVTSTPINR